MLSRLSAVVLSFLIVPSTASSQTPDRGPRLGGVVSGAFGNGGPAPSVAVSAGYRFTPRFGVEVDASYMGGLDFGDFPVCAPDHVCVARNIPALTVLGGTISLNGRAATLSVSESFLVLGSLFLVARFSLTEKRHEEPRTKNQERIRFRYRYRFHPKASIITPKMSVLLM